MLQTEQQRYDMLLRLLQGQGGGAALPGATLQPPGTEEGAPADPAAGPAKKTKTAAAPAVEKRFGSVEGKVTGAGSEEAYVYVENVRGPLAKSKSLEIRQEGRQFVPGVAVVQAGTSVTFPNFDTVYHNVFSSSPRNAFDLGTYRAGDKPRSVTLTGSGVVEVFCNIHQKMNAKILVVPSPLFAKVKADGTFRIDNVPVGARKVVVWSPRGKPLQQKLELTGAGAQVSFALDKEEASAHLNKFGQPYGSYKD
jgi:plastocyanin